MIERKIGTIITDQYGNANYTYTGGGKGKRDIVMKCGSVVSEPYTVWDYLFYDKGILDDPLTNNNYDVTSNITRTDTGTELSNGTNYANLFPKLNNTAYLWTNPIAFELDIVSITGSSYGMVVQFYDGTNLVNKTLGNIGVTGECTIRCEYDGSQIKYYKNGTLVSDITETKTFSSAFRVGLQTQGNNVALKFKEFRIYGF